jgi:hypothetical protein
MLRTVLVAGLAVSVVAGAGVLTLRTLGDEAKETFGTLNEAFADSEPGQRKASAQEVADWIARYRTDARKPHCQRGADGWDYVCVFRNRQGRQVKVGVIVNSRQPIQMSPAVRTRRPLARPIET